MAAVLLMYALLSGAPYRTSPRGVEIWVHRRKYALVDPLALRADEYFGWEAEEWIHWIVKWEPPAGWSTADRRLSSA